MCLMMEDPLTLMPDSNSGGVRIKLVCHNEALLIFNYITRSDFEVKEAPLHRCHVIQTQLRSDDLLPSGGTILPVTVQILEMWDDTIQF